MPEVIYKEWRILLMPFQHDNGLWTCPYVYERRDAAEAVLNHNEPPGLWDTMNEAEAASLAHAKAWIDAQQDA
jgi:hypothetical protein